MNALVPSSIPLYARPMEKEGLIISSGADDESTFDERNTSLQEVLAKSFTASGESLLTLSNTAPTLLIFLRHLKCTFCLEALQEVKKALPTLIDLGVICGFVSRNPVKDLQKLLKTYDLSSCAALGDQGGVVYKIFRMKQATASALLSPKLLLRVLQSTLHGNIQTGVEGDPRQLGGVVLLYKGAIIAAKSYTTPADKVDYVSFTRAALERVS